MNGGSAGCSLAKMLASLFVGRWRNGEQAEDENLDDYTQYEPDQKGTHYRLALNSKNENGTNNITSNRMVMSSISIVDRCD